MRLLILSCILILSGLSLKAQEGKNPLKAIMKGVASYYHEKFEGRLTANGEVFDNNRFTGASNKLKLGSYVKVTNVSNGEVIYVRINDRMAKSSTRVIDLTTMAAKKLDFQDNGIAKVKLEVVSEEEGREAILTQREKAGLEKIIPAIDKTKSVKQPNKL